jgi:D-aminopeptidase
MTSAQTHTADGRPRARGLAIPLPGQPGPLNAITDVPGVEVGGVTLIDGDGPLEVGRGPVRTGVTAILPRGRDGVGRACAAGWYSLNGNGEMTGTTWIEESGSFNVPVVLSNTHAVGACHTGVTSWINKVNPRLARQWLLPVCAETWDGYLNDINGGHVRPEHVEAALDAAALGPVAEGSVGGGTGMNCYEFKGGNGTASRVVTYGAHTFTVGAFVQANFGSRGELTVAGRHVGALLADDNPLDSDWFAADLGPRPPPGAGSVIAVVATDAPLLPGQCKALARRVPLGLARTGTTGSHLRRHLSGLLDGRRRRSAQWLPRRPARRRRIQHDDLHSMGSDGSLLCRGRPGRGRGGAQLVGGQRCHGRTRRSPRSPAADRSLDCAVGRHHRIDRT